MAALAKTYRLLSQLSNAKSIIEYGYNNLPENQRVTVEYANILHLMDDGKDKELAHQLINSILEKKIAASTESEIGLLNYFCFSEDYIDSSIFAALFMNAGDTDMESWERLAEEYYYCPVFRHEHAVKLGKSGDAMRSLAKLNSLADEFPWFKPGLISIIGTIKQFRLQMKNPLFMDAELKKFNEQLSAL